LFIEFALRKGQSDAAGSLLALADPLYGRPASIAGATLEEVQAATRGSRHLAYFDPLPDTRTEAQAISKMFDGGKVELLLGEQALESRVKTLDLTQFGFLHFATHGILGGEVPGIGEPALVLGAAAANS
jgi:CHAT domain-containing protein